MTAECAVPNCPVKAATVQACPQGLFRFPKNLERCFKWVQRCGSRKLLYKTPQELHSNFFLCGNHFEQTAFRNKYHRNLLPKACPAIDLPPALSENSMDIFLNKEYHMPTKLNTNKAASFSLNFPPKRAADFIEETTETIPDLDNNIPLGEPTTQGSGLKQVNNINPAVENQLQPENNKIDDRDRNNHVGLKKLAEEAGLDGAQLSENEKKALLIAREYKRKVEKVKYALKLARRRKKGSLKKISRESIIETIDEMLEDDTRKAFLISQIRNEGKANGRSWKDEDKVFAMGIYKRSRATYLWLMEHLILPSEDTIKRLLACVTLEPGICPVLVKHLKVSAEKMHDQDKFVTIAFDEASLRSQLLYNMKTKTTSGFENFGKRGSTSRVANTDLVFMVRGIRKRWKMPVAYFPAYKQTPGLVLAKLIEDVVRAVTEAGYVVVATISDQGGNNRTAIKELRKSCEEGIYENVYKVDQHLIVHIWDMPHIIKNIRNCLLTSNIILQNKMVVQWQHIVDYARYVEKYLCGKSTLTINHVFPTGRNKMRVKYATQVFSETVAKHIETIMVASEGRSLLQCSPTLLFITMMDKFIDSCNGASSKDKKKPYRDPVTPDSIHHAIWKDIQTEVGSWEYERTIGKTKGKKHQGPVCISGWLQNIKGFQRIAKFLFSDNVQFSSFSLRSFNQDPVENFFSRIRQVLGSNRNPTCNQFKSAFKSVLLANLSEPVKIDKNCEDDDDDDLLLNLDDFIDLCCSEEPEEEVCDQPILIRGLSPEMAELSKFTKSRAYLTKVRRQSPATLCSKLIQSIFKKKEYSDCLTCKESLSTDTLSSDHILQRSLLYASPHLINFYMKIEKKFLDQCHDYLHRRDVHQWAVSLCEDSYDWLCPQHCDEIRLLLQTHIADIIIDEVCKVITKRINAVHKMPKDKNKKTAKTIYQEAMSTDKSTAWHRLYSSESDDIDDDAETEEMCCDHEPNIDNPIETTDSMINDVDQEPTSTSTSPLSSTSTITITGPLPDTSISNAPLTDFSSTTGLLPEISCTSGPLSGTSISTENEELLRAFEEAEKPFGQRQSLQLKWITTLPQGVGLQNVGNTCFLNSILQALFHIPPFFYWMKRVVHTDSCTCTLCYLKEINEACQQQKDALELDKELVFELLRAICPRYKNYEQQDAHEYLKLLTEQLDYDKGMKEIFGGHIKQEVVCRKCNFMSHTYQPFSDLLVPVVQKGSLISSIIQSIQYYFKKEDLEYKCPGCHTQGPATKASKICELPRILCIILKRFDENKQKSCKKINYTLQLDLRNFVDSTIKAAKYNIQAVVNHIGGTLAAGHYTATICSSKNRIREFYTYDDAVVERRTWSGAMLADSAYILFYTLEE